MVSPHMERDRVLERALKVMSRWGRGQGRGTGRGRAELKAELIRGRRRGDGRRLLGMAFKAPKGLPGGV